mmetsp:Transcript_56432/g.138645  ORF Transcript_56432/g.138645 Transcript_56432/m.138645 type:complete len:220 (+) Transcript_56432:128-787(+)
MHDVVSLSPSSPPPAAAPIPTPPAYLPALAAFVTAVVSFVQLATATDVCTAASAAGGAGCTGIAAYAVAAGVVSFAAALAAVVIERYADDLAAKARIVLAVLCVGWWVPAVAVITGARGVFAGVGNGYLATWGAFAAALWWLRCCLVAVYGEGFCNWNRLLKGVNEDIESSIGLRPLSGKSMSNASSITHVSDPMRASVNSMSASQTIRNSQPFRAQGA